MTQGKVVYATSDSALFHEVDAQSGKPLLKQDVGSTDGAAYAME